MSLRKKHVRRAVLACLMLGVLGVAGALVVYGVTLTTRGAAYDQAIAAELESRLRCKATVLGARQTGFGRAAADSVELKWMMGDGTLTLALHDLRAERGSAGWSVQAVTGDLALAGADTRRVLEALNQRLVQVTSPTSMAGLGIMNLHVALHLGRLTVDGHVGAAVTRDGAGILCRVRSDEPQLEWREPAVVAALRLDPTGERGVFSGLKLRVEPQPISVVRDLIPDLSKACMPLKSGTIALALDWPATNPAKARLKVTVHGLDLAEVAACSPDLQIIGQTDFEATLDGTQLWATLSQVQDAKTAAAVKP